MYYLWSLFAALIIIGYLQYNEYNKNPENYNIKSIVSLSSIATFAVIYLIITIIFYFIFGIDYKCINKIQKGGNSNTSSISIDPVMLKRIPDKIYTGFNPHDLSEVSDI